MITINTRKNNNDKKKLTIETRKNAKIDKEIYNNIDENGIGWQQWFEFMANLATS